MQTQAKYSEAVDRYEPRGFYQSSTLPFGVRGRVAQNWVVPTRHGSMLQLTKPIVELRKFEV